MAFTIPAGVTLPWDGTAASIPAGWSRETTLDARYVKAILNNATNPGGTGGATNHDHPFSAHNHTGGSHGHTASSANTSDVGGSNNSQVGVTQYAGTHHHSITYTAATANASGNNATPANFDATTTEPPYYEVIWIKSDGTPTGFPSNVLAFVAGAAPANWTAHAGSANRLFKGAAAAGNGGGSGGSGDAHPHTSATHSHPAGATPHSHSVSFGLSVASNTDEVNGVVAQQLVKNSDHGHASATSGTANPAFSGTASPSSPNGDMTPPWLKFLPIKNTSGGTVKTKGIIGIWTGTLATIPNAQGWYLCDGTNSTPTILNTYVRGAANSGEVGLTGGALTHTHAAGGAHTHSVDNHSHTGGNTGASTGTLQAGALGAALVEYVHLHTYAASNTDGTHTSGSQTVSASANASNDPLFTTVAYITFINTPPTAPTINSPLASVAYSGSLTLDATVSDDDGDAVFAEFQYDRNDGNWVTIGNGSTVASGGNSTRVWDISGFAPGFNYRVRARSNDGQASFNVSAYTTTGTFIIGPGFAGLYATTNTARYRADQGYD